MKDVDLKLSKPYTRDNAPADCTHELTFSCKFDDADKALAFHQMLIQLIRENHNA